MKPLVVPFFITHKGCPHRCIFCDQATISGSAGDFPNAADIRSRISAYRSHAEGRPIEVAFYGGTFTALPHSVQKTLLDPVQQFITDGTVASVRISTRPDAVDPEIASFLVMMGVKTVELGVQTMDDAVLDRAGRGHASVDTIAACKILQDQALAVGVQLMTGLPADTPGGARASLRRVLDLKPAFLRIYPAVVIAGTGLEELYRRGDYAPMSIDEAIQCCKVMLHDALRRAVPVIRCGLQDSAELRHPGAIVAGPHHPAFRQLVEGELFFDLMLSLVDGMPADHPLTMICSPSKVSEAAGHRRMNLLRLTRMRGLRVAAVRGEPSFSPIELMVAAGDIVKKGNIVHDLHYPEEVCAVGC